MCSSAVRSRNGDSAARGRSLDGHALAVRQPGLQRIVNELEAQLVETDRFGLEPGNRVELCECRAAPQLEGSLRIAPAESANGVEVELVRLQPEAVAALALLQPVGPRAELAAEPADLVVQRLHGVVRRFIRPQCVHEPNGGQAPVAGNREHGQQGAAPETPDDDLSCFDPHSERPEQVDVHCELAPVHHRTVPELPGSVTSSPRVTVL